MWECEDKVNVYAMAKGSIPGRNLLNGQLQK